MGTNCIIFGKVMKIGVLVSNFHCFTKYDAFCSHSFDYACLRRLRHFIVMKRFEIKTKFYSSKALLKMAGWGMYTPHFSLDPPLFIPSTSKFHLRDPSGLHTVIVA